MTKKEKIENFIEKYNGYLITSLVCNEDISKTYVAQYIKEDVYKRQVKYQSEAYMDMYN